MSNKEPCIDCDGRALTRDRGAFCPTCGGSGNLASRTPTQAIDEAEVEFLRAAYQRAFAEGAESTIEQWRCGSSDDPPEMPHADCANEGAYQFIEDMLPTLRTTTPATVAVDEDALVERLRLHRSWRDSHGELNDAPNEAADRIEALERERDALRDVCEMVARASMGEVRPSRGESFIGWQKGDGADAQSVRKAARAALANPTLSLDGDGAR